MQSACECLMHIKYPLMLVSSIFLYATVSTMWLAQHVAEPSHSAFMQFMADDPGGYNVLVVGAGLSGAVLARQHAELNGHRVLVIEKRNHIGGNCYDYTDEETGIRMSMYGAHLFHTNNERVWAFVNRFSKWSRWDHRVLASLAGLYVPIPVNIETVNLVYGLHLQTPEEMAAWLDNVTLHTNLIENSKQMAMSRVGVHLYDLIFGPYTEKQWNMSAEHLGPEVTARIPVRLSFDNRYFDDKYQALPAHGYHAFFQNMLHHPNITVLLEHDYFKINVSSLLLPDAITYYTGPIDHFFASEEKLQYRSLRFDKQVLYHHVGYAQPASVVNYPASHVPFTRIVEYKHMLHQHSNHTILIREYPSETGEPYYPVPSERNKQLYQKLLSKTRALSHIVFVGRLANYKYFNMDEAIANALRVYDQQQRNLHIVTTVFEEDLSQWTKPLCLALGPDVRVSWFIYNKHPTRVIDHSCLEHCHTISVHEIRHPNVGREGYSWLKYMEAKNFGHTNLFLQGNLHSLELAEILQATRNGLSAPSSYFFEAIPHFAVECAPQWNYEPAFMSDLVRVTDFMHVNRTQMCVHYYGQFVVSAASLSRAWLKWRKCFETLMLPALDKENNPTMGHALERLWVEIFSGTT